LAQVVFAGVTHLAGGPGRGEGKPAVGGMRLAFAGFDLCLLALLLWRFRAQPGRAVVWGWSPLVAIEFAGSAHFDSLGILLFMAALLCFEGRAKFVAQGYALLALGMLVKFLPLAAFAFSTKRRRELWPGAMVLGLVFGLGFLPLYWLQGGFGGLTAGVSQYALRWESFSLLFRVIEWPFEHFFEHSETWTDARRLSRLAIFVLLSSVALWAWCRRLGAVFASYLLIAGFLLLTPTLHPWYLTWLIPFLAFRPSIAWTWLLVLAPLLYWPLTEWQARAEWIEPDWLWPLLCLPFLAMLVAECMGKGPFTKDVTKIN
jgi:hypothetical protein